MLQPNKKEMLAALDAVEIALSSMMRRWQDGIPPKVRDEIAQIYRPVLLLLIRAKRRGQFKQPQRLGAKRRGQIKG